MTLAATTSANLASPSKPAAAVAVAVVAPRPPMQSPLKRVNTSDISPPRPKLHTCWHDLTTKPNLFAQERRPHSDELQRWFLDLFCLRPNSAVIESALDALQTSQLLGSYKDNIAHVFTQAVGILKNADRTDSRRDNVVNTLIPFLRNLLGRRYSNFSFEVMTLLAGSLEQADSVFTDIVAAIDLILQDVESTIQMRHRTLQLALVLVASVNQGSITAYFLRRDLFSTLVKFMADSETAPYAFESTVLLGLLANYRKYEARNPYGVRIEDFVEDNVMSRIIDVVCTVSSQAREAYITVTDDSSPSFVASLTSLVFSFRIGELLSSFSMSLPPAASSVNGNGTVSADGSPSLKGKEKEDASLLATSIPDIRRSSTTSLATAPSSHKPSNGHAAAMSARPAAAKREESAFSPMPPEIIVILLPFFDLLNLNKAFCTLVYSEMDGGPPELPRAVISFSSYVACHASTSARATIYARLCLLILAVFVEEGEGKLTCVAEPIRLCHQRHPMLPPNSEPRPLIAAILDTAVIFLRHNLKRQLDVDTYIVCLRLVQRSMQQLKTERVRLAYDWVPLWRSVVSLAAFVVSRIAELRQLSSSAHRIDSLIASIFVILSYPAFWGEHFFVDSRTSALLHYEILHAESTLAALADLLGLSYSSTTNSPLLGSLHAAHVSSPESRRSSHIGTSMMSINAAGLFPLTSPVGSYANGAATSGGPSSSSSSTTAISIAAECVSNIRTSILHFKRAIEVGAPSHVSASTNSSTDSPQEPPPPRVDLSEVDPDEIIRVVEANLSSLELIESSAMHDLRRGEVASSGMGASGQEAYFRMLTQVVSRDVLALIPMSCDG